MFLSCKKSEVVVELSVLATASEGAFEDQRREPSGPSQGQRDLWTLQQLRERSMSAVQEVESGTGITLLRLSMGADEVTLFNAISAVASYASQLRALSAKVNLDDQKLVQFVWTNALNSASFSSHKLAFELGAVLFNAATLLSTTGRATVMSIDPAHRGTFPAAIKAACNALLTAAAAFQEIKTVFPLSQDSACIDFTPAVLDALEAVLIADAQELFLKKAVFDNMSPSTIAKLASGTAETFRRAYTLLAASSINGVFPAYWIQLARGKLGLYEGISFYNQSKVVAATSDAGFYGIQIAWLRAAQNALKSVHVEVFDGGANLAMRILKGVTGADTSAGFYFQESLNRVKAEVMATMEFVNGVLVPAEKDNDIIYVESVPALSALTMPTAAIMVKPDIAPLFDIYITNKIFPPLFETLTPLYIRQSQERYLKVRTEHLQPIEDLQTATTNCRTGLASINLPNAIESVFKPDSQILLEMQQTVMRDCVGDAERNGQVPPLAHMMQSAASLLLSQRDKTVQLLRAARAALDTEEAEDAEMRHGFGARWARVESTELTRGLREAIGGYADKLDDAQASDAIVLGKVDGNFQNLALLGDEGLLSVLIQGGGGGPLGESGIAAEAASRDEVNKLKGALALLNDLISKRELLFQDVQAAKAADDILPSILEASNGVHVMNEEDVFMANLKKYDAFVETSLASLTTQNNIMALITTRNQKFMEWVQTNERLTKRTEFIADHARGVALFKEIMTNLGAGIEFYTDFEPILKKLLVNCQDFCMTRGIEKKELLAELQQKSISQERQVWDGNLSSLNFKFDHNPPPSAPPPFKRQ
ncbi:hypothetical protein CcCBS67573_g03147 [Chytriomyces confervae]|uniref:BRO1 domain-containing protein n=1 Tax=Chytriomyces confervae TaxID=246404 RepID=A0A507FH25_9FUNG|nr:hypothetical protein CcCBS67573_g03147 [Chytriomyces confervae]